MRGIVIPWGKDDIFQKKKNKKNYFLFSFKYFFKKKKKRKKKSKPQSGWPTTTHWGGWIATVGSQGWSHHP
jgi:hypothetical protein